MTNPIESLRNSIDLDATPFVDQSLRGMYRESEDKYKFLKEFVKGFTKPHYPALNFIEGLKSKNIQIDNRLFRVEFEKELSLIKNKEEHIEVMLNGICFNNEDKFYYESGLVRIGLVIDNAVDLVDNNGIRIIKDNPLAQANLISFRSLKDFSKYDGYISDSMSGYPEDLVTKYDLLFQVIKDLETIETETIIYVVNDKIVREVTLHDFGKYGNILTITNLEV